MEARIKLRQTECSAHPEAPKLRVEWGDACIYMWTHWVVSDKGMNGMSSHCVNKWWSSRKNLAQTLLRPDSRASCSRRTRVHADINIITVRNAHYVHNRRALTSKEASGHTLIANSTWIKDKSLRTEHRLDSVRLFKRLSLLSRVIYLSLSESPQSTVKNAYVNTRRSNHIGANTMLIPRDMISIAVVHCWKPWL